MSQYFLSRLEVLEEIYLVYLNLSNLASLKTEVDKLNIDKLAPVLVDLSKLSDAVKTYLDKKAVYDKLAIKVNNINTSTFF